MTGYWGVGRGAENMFGEGGGTNWGGEWVGVGWKRVGWIGDGEREGGGEVREEIMWKGGVGVGVGGTGFIN